MKKVIMMISFITFLQANYLVKIIAVVNNEPITNIDLISVKENFNLDENEALKRLVQNKLSLSLAKDFQISVNPLEIDEELSKIANNSKLSLEEFKKENKDKIEILSNNIKEELLKNKLFQAIAQNNAKEPSEDDMLKFYMLNKDKMNNASYEVAKMQIKNYLINQSAQEAIQTYMEKEESKAKIKFYED